MSLLAVMTLTLGSCTEEYEYSAAKAEGEQVYFSNELSSTVELSNTESSYAIQINRINTTGELTVNLTLSDESGIYSIPSSVTFAQGDSTATFDLSYDPSVLEVRHVFNSVTVAIADAEYTTPYGNSSYTFSAGMSSPYVSLGTGTYMDAGLYGDTPFDVEIMQNQNNPNMFRIMHPYDEIAAACAEEYGDELSGDPAEYLELEILQPGDVLNGVTITMSGLVYYSPTATSIVDATYGMPYILYHPCSFSSTATEEYWTYNAVTAYQDNGLPGTIQLAPVYYMEGVGGYNYSQYSDMILITFPGYEASDYSVGVSYLGAFSSADGISYAIGNVTLGDDIDEAQVAVVEGTDVNNALSQILSGAVETVTVTESGEVRIPCDYSGDCIMVAIGYAGGEMQNYGYAAFTFSLGPSEWTSLGTGLYTDYVLGSTYVAVTDQSTGEQEPAPAITYEVEVQESTTTPGIYRLVNPYSPANNYYTEAVFADSYNTTGNTFIIINASDPDAVYIQTQSTGIDYGNGNGDIFMFSYGGSYIDYGYSFETVKNAGLLRGKLENGVISFEADELWTAPEAMLASGYAFIVNDEAVEILTLPSAVTGAAKAKAAKRAEALNGKTLTKAGISTKNAVKNKKDVKKSLQKLQPVGKVVYKRK